MIRSLIPYSIVLMAFLAGCSSTREMVNNDYSGQPADIEYSVVYYIHADAGYLYHDAKGKAVRGNSRVLDTAREVAEKAHSGEVFIFYQRPEKKFLGLFPRKRSRLYHYRNGQISTQVKYRHSDGEEPFLATEARLYKRYGNQSPEKDRQHYFLYFGHEVPKGKGTNYHRTLPDIEVNTASLAGGMRQFIGTDEQKFDLAVLSTCNNGTPEMAERLMPVTELLLASPQNLHLSHIDTDSLALLEREPEPTPVELARSMAGQTYRRLAETIQTAITLALYDLDPVRPYIDELRTSAAAHEQSTQANSFKDNTDCAQLPFFEAGKYGAGVESWYKPARFGRGGNSDTHSGWGCMPVLKN